MNQSIKEEYTVILTGATINAPSLEAVELSEDPFDACSC